MDGPSRPVVGYLLLGSVVLVAGTSAALIMLGLPQAGGVAAMAAAAAVVASGRAAKYGRRPQMAFADSTAERAADAVVLGAVAWAYVETDPLTSASAIVALVLGYLAAYVRAKATGLGFPVQESLIARAVRAGMIIGGLLYPPALQAALWLASGVSLFSVVRESAEVAARKEPS